MKTVHFICRGNVFRSRIAEAYLRSRGYEAHSSGTVARAHDTVNALNQQKVTSFLRAKGLGEYLKPAWTQLDQDCMHPDELVVCMDDAVHQEAVNIVSLPADSLVWDIADQDNLDDSQLNAFIEYTYGRITHYVDELITANN